MSVIEKSIELNVPVKTAYNQWTQFEEQRVGQSTRFTEEDV
jgi:hypothetical protein